MQTLDDWITHLERLGGADAPDLPPDATLLAGDRGEQRLWRACSADSEAELAPAVAPMLSRASGPLLEPDAYLAIEVWAECELAALHALHRLARQAPAPLGSRIRERTAHAWRWHLEHTQPDNSTNRPWAIHVFLLADDPTAEARLYAETLLHNMAASHAREEPLSRWILADAARELRLCRNAARGA